MCLTIRLNPQNSGKSDLEVKKEALRKVIEDKALLSEAVKRGFLAIFWRARMKPANMPRNRGRSSILPKSYQRARNSFTSSSSLRV